MIIKAGKCAFGLAILLVSPGVSAQSPLDAKSAFVCKLVPAWQRPEVKGFNFGVLLAEDARPVAETSVAVVETVDNIEMLSGAQIVRFYDNGNGHFAGLTGDFKNKQTLMLSLAKSTRGPWFDAGILPVGKNAEPKFTGVCFGLKTNDTAADFQKAMAKSESAQ